MAVPFDRLPTRSLGLKLLLVCALAGLMSIPAIFVAIVLWDRTTQADKAVAEISQIVGGQQSVLGPIIVVPYTAPPADPKDQIIRGNFVVYPETGDVKSTLSVEARRRSIYQVPVFNANVDFSAQFGKMPDAASRLPQGAKVYWGNARIYMGVSDLRGARSEAVLTLSNGETRTFEPAPEAGSTLNLMAVPAADLIAKGEPFGVSAEMKLAGAKRFSVLPFAKSTTASAKSDWVGPSFEGGFLPNNPAISKAGFEAKWSVPFLARNEPGAEAMYGLGFDQLFSRDMAVRLVKEDTAYRFIARSLKYSPLFVGLVFIAYFLFEVTTGKRVHPAQFILIGLAQAVFYLLLLSFSEHVGFDWAFLIAAIAAVAQIGLYAGAVFGARAYAYRALAVFAGVYALLYVLMRLEDYALVVGAIASFAAIALTMWMTRNVDWYGGRAEAHA